eukprot:TRINITY_DN75870_c0_g1_i1.p1 TRINITY_DN75870_c0_g1~~TRINITY_DN75870_c0_g1_i1.p1  ORF type:complete len:417 (-),score=93.71 TRINITY_DN75870_c0_g1_i1:12-1241(-)
MVAAIASASASSCKLQRTTKASSHGSTFDGRQQSRNQRRAAGSKTLGMLACWLFLYATPALLLFTPGLGVQPVLYPRTSLPRTAGMASDESSADESSDAKLQRLKAEVEVAEARAAVAQAKAALAAAQAGESRVDEVSSPPATVSEAPSVAVPVLDLASFSEDERRPAAFFFDREGAELFDLFERLENVEIMGMANVTQLDAVLRGWFMSIYQFTVASMGDLPPDAPEDVRRNIKDLGGSLDADAIASALAPRGSGSDWRPFVKGLGENPRFADIMEDALQFQILFPEPITRATGLSLDECKARVLNFFRGSSFKEAGSWTDAELQAAERLVANNPKLQKVLGRFESVRESLSETIKTAAGAPLVALGFLLLSIAFCCFGMGQDPNLNGGAGSMPQADTQNLPLFKLEK